MNICELLETFFTILQEAGFTICSPGKSLNWFEGPKLHINGIGVQFRKLARGAIFSTKEPVDGFVRATSPAASHLECTVAIFKLRNKRRFPIKFCTGRLLPEPQTLTLEYTNFPYPLGPGLTRRHCCGNIAADANVSQFSGARNICCGRIGSKEMFLNQGNVFWIKTQILLPKPMFPSLATQGKMSGNNVS